MSAEQLALLVEAVAPAARHADPVTSKVAAATMREGAALQRSQVLAALERRGFAGAIYTELAADTGLEPVAIDRRLPELRRVGEAARLKETRQTPSDRPAHVHVAVAYVDGRELA
jgi:hypothetical protein